MSSPAHLDCPNLFFMDLGMALWLNQGIWTKFPQLPMQIPPLQETIF